MNLRPVIEVIDLSKSYKIYNKPIDRLIETIHPFRRKKHHLFTALSDIKFQVYAGETVGILGKNGSGKSTLLKIIAGVLSPTDGQVNVRGKVAALLELGAGFNPEYSGRENIYLNGTIMGFTKHEIDKRIDEIIDFADIGEFIDQPVKTYSSGMFARLAFSVAINVDPDILIIDEALSVGDMQFQEKSFTKMKQFRSKGKTIFFVSHSISSVRNFCDRAIWIHQGELKMIGPSDEICLEYQDYMNDEKEKLHATENSVINQEAKIVIENVHINQNVYSIDDDIEISISLKFNEEIANFGVGVIIYNAMGSVVTLYSTVRDDIYFNESHSLFKLLIPKNDFVRGKYFVSVAISDELSMFPFDRKDFIGKFEVVTKKNRNGIPIADGMFRSKHLWEY
ncbi:ABC transporter ATP-binding protein [Paenibacillus harenae]|uniref:ABC transporter ATP-binding protein n=1 Tax=Paenibacillus harenae TaxID=306543 RepID=UPI00040255B9|nr:ABC transporter ATP-binding protein [Paenibacillus harenae]